MAEFKGTKGPWKIDNHAGIFNQGGLYQIPISGNDRKNRQVSNVFGVNKVEGKANAKIISCAPEMLEMLKEVLELLEENQGEAKFYTKGHFVKLSNLIKKATDL